MNAARASLLVIDAHVHIYGCFDRRRFLDAAFSNSSRAAGEYGAGMPHVALLLLTESRRERAFRDFSEQGKNGLDGTGNDGFRVSATEEAESLRVENAAGAILFLISGRQVVTSEGLEVLAFATSSEIPDGQPLGRTVGTALAAGAPVALPWGFGKWRGNRGKMLKEFLASHRQGGVFLGDNGGRPGFLRMPRFRRDDDGSPLKVLPGSDPLPLPCEEGRVGGFGFTLREDIDPLRPAASMKRILSNPCLDPVPFGPPENPIRFFRNQLLLRLWKHRT